ncbi:MAG: glycosyltransferase family 4 protein [Candidatus Verstraetearchaeota archaeon]|nr:glycosyltransferase family 4 protein [Candidatus Verstraetearchaeota archaeon]
MKIVYILSTSRGGLPHYVAELANAVSKHAEVTVIKPKETSADNLFSSKINLVNAFEPIALSYVDLEKKHVSVLEAMRSLLSFRNIKLVDDIKPDVVHFPTGLFPTLTFFASLYRLDKKYPCIVTYHYVFSRKLILRGRDVYSGEPLLTIIALNVGNILNNLLSIQTAKIIVHTERDKNVLIGKGIDPRKICVIPHGYYSIFRNYSPKTQEEKNCILFFGNIIASKGVDVLVKSIPIVCKEIPDIKVVIAGDGVIPRESWKIIKQFKSNFEIHNYFIPNEMVCDFFHRASLVVLPYKGQGGYSGVFTIACSFGKPVVATNIGELPILVRNAGCGLVVPPEDPKALAEAIVKLLKDDELREQMGRNALKKAEELSWDNIAKMHMKVYEEVLNEWGKRSKR